MKGPSRTVLGCTVVVIAFVLTCGRCGLSTSREFIRFQKLAHLDAGTAFETAVADIEREGFTRRADEGEPIDDAGVSTTVFVKNNWPPIGPWRLRVRHGDSGVIDVNSVIPD